MRNIPLIFARCFAVWRTFRAVPGVFSFSDACKGIDQVLQPGRITEWQLRRFIDRQLEITTRPDGVHEVRLKGEGLMFYWGGRICGGLANGVLQEIDPGHPHYYTSDPVKLSPSCRVLDVGACEGLFAFRTLKRGLAQNVTCFEPSQKTASLLRKAAEFNGCADKIEVEVAAVGATSGEVFFSDSSIPEANRVVAAGTEGGQKIRQVSLDDYCLGKKLTLNSCDLIKVDAEGADLDVIKGAVNLIRAGSPQIAVTTYHNTEHAQALIRFLRSIQPAYCFRLKGLTLWNSPDVPRPILLQASMR